jgi:ATP-dependent protease ClpP protease subunit/regulator of replication initiation timing
MATTNTKTNYNLHLKGFVGGYDFDADYVDYILGKNTDKEVNVLIDSLGGQSSTALSIFSAFKRHGNVNVHFVGMNASAATIASLGAKHITMDSSAMYLVHKCSVGFFEWGQLNSDGLQALIDNIEHQKADLDKLDANIAQMYATRCKKEPAELLTLMKAGGWLTAQEALSWGFVDELTDYEGEDAPVLTDTMASAMSAAGIPVPNMPTMKLTPQEQSAFAKFLSALTQFLPNSKSTELINSQTKTPMKKILTSVCAILSCEHLMSHDGKITLDDTQMDSIESAISADKQTINDLNAQIATLKSEKQTLTDSNAQLQDEVNTLKQKPADTTVHVVNDKHEEQPAEKTDAEQYFESRANAQSLFDALP